MTYDGSKFENDTPFDPSEFIVPSNDTKGHSVLFHFRASSLIKRAIQQVIGSRKFPYLTDSDVIRHALVRHLSWLTEISDDIPTVRHTLVMLKLEIVRLQRLQEDREFQAYFDLMRQEIQALMSREGGVREAQREVSRALSVIRQMPDGFYRNQYLSQIEREFGHVLDISLAKREQLGPGGNGNGSSKATGGGVI